MSTNPSNTLSQTLHSITAIKLRELSKQRSAFTSRKAHILAHLDDQDDDKLADATTATNERITHLLTSIVKLQDANKASSSKSLDGIDSYELDRLLGATAGGGGGEGKLPPVANIRHFLRQSQYDPSMPASVLPELERRLRRLLEQKEERFAFADLYSRLLTEWLESDDARDRKKAAGTAGQFAAAAAAAAAPAAGADEDSGSDDDESGVVGFEVVERQKERLKQLSEKFESVVFEPLEVDATTIEDLMNGLFVGDDAQKALTKLRKRIQAFGEYMAGETRPFDLTSLKWCIKGLLKSDLLSDANKMTLEAFLRDDVVLAEIADVLNMRFVDLGSWSWDADEEGIPVEPRRQLNGKYRVVMDEDILQSIFLHYIGTIWAVEFNSALKDVVSNRSVWKLTQQMPRAEVEKRRYYFGEDWVNANNGVSLTRQTTYEQNFFMCQLPSSVDTIDGAGGYEDEVADEVRELRNPSGPHIKQQLLRTIGTEILIQRSLSDQVAVVQSDLQWFATSTAHGTVDTICKFFGVPSVWRRFFQKYLAAPLRMVGLEGEQGKVRTRKRGVPIGHVFQKLFGELIVFSMDLAVNQEAKMLLYRLHDDLWLCGDPENCAKAWRAMEHCAKVMGVEFNQAKTGSAYITGDGVARDAHIATALPKGRVVLGFLQLQAETGNWVIDQVQVDAHAKQLQKQLAECTSVFAWVQTWNSCIGRFFNFTFGEPANCFGRGHVDMILETHRGIQQELFSGSTAAINKMGKGESSTNSSSSVTQYLKSFISARSEVPHIPDAFLYFPEEMGGLGLRNPFIPFLVVRDQVTESPPHKMEQFFEAERNAYDNYKKQFQALSDRDRRHRLKAIQEKQFKNALGFPLSTDWHGGETWSGPLEKDSAFLPWQEFIEYRIASSVELQSVYNDLLATPRKNDVQPSRDVSDAMYYLGTDTPELIWDKMTSEQKWLVQSYANEVFNRFGGLILVEKGTLPMGVLKVVRGRKVVWQSVL